MQFMSIILWNSIIGRSAISFRNRTLSLLSVIWFVFHTRSPSSIDLLFFASMAKCVYVGVLCVCVQLQLSRVLFMLPLRSIFATATSEIVTNDTVEWNTLFVFDYLLLCCDYTNTKNVRRTAVVINLLRSRKETQKKKERLARNSLTIQLHIYLCLFFLRVSSVLASSYRICCNDERPSVQEKTKTKTISWVCCNVVRCVICICCIGQHE